MGRIVAKIKVENLADILLAERGEMPPQKTRWLQLEALVDTGATFLCLPAKAIHDLGLSLLGSRRVATPTGVVERRIFRGAQVTILNRTCSVDVMELEDSVPPLVGYIPLQSLDLKVDPQRETVIPNPEHGDEIVLDLFFCSEG